MTASLTGRYRTHDSAGGATMAPPASAPAAAETADPWREWLRAGIAAEREHQTELTELERGVLASIIARGDRRLDDEIKSVREDFEAVLRIMREEYESKLAMSRAELASELAMRTAELNVEVIAMKADICRRMEATIVEMRKVLAAGDARAADTLLNWGQQKQ
jgi:hypothetical protein